MAILSTNQRLINVGDSYSAGNGIDITNNIISVTGDSVPYSAGDNIDIQDHIISGKDWSNDIEQASANAYNVTTAWVQDNYANSADMTYISAMVDTKLDTSAWSSVSGDLATESYVIMADNINYAQATAYVENQNYANKDFVLDNIDSATSGKLDSSSFASVSGDFLTTAFGISESGAWNEATDCVENNSAAWFDNQGDVEVNELVYAQSANWNEVSSKLDSTAFDTWQQGQYTNDIAGLNNLIGTKLDASSFEETSGTFYPTSNPSGFITGVDLTPYYTTAEANTLSSMLSGAIDFVSANADDPEVTNLVQTNSGVWNEVTNKLDTTSFSDVSGTFYTNDNPSGFITGVDLSNYYTKDETSGKEELANAFANIPVGDPEVNAYVTSNSASIDESTNLVQSNSSTWNDVTAYQSNSANYLTAHQSLEGLMSASLLESADGKWTAYNSIPFKAGDEFPASADEAIQAYQTNSSTYLTAHQSLDGLMSANLLEFNAENHISSYNGSAFEDSAPTLPMTGRDGVDVQMDNGTLVLSSTLYETVTTNSANWSQNDGDAEVNAYVHDNSATIDDVVSTYQGASGTYYTTADANTLSSMLSGAIDDKLNTDVFTAWSADQFANDYQLSAGNGIKLIDDDINKITRIDVTAGGGTGGDMFTSYLEYNDQNQISGYAGSAFAGQGGGDVPTGTMNVSGLEYNAVNEISAYNGSAIAQYGAEKQWLVHDDTLVHAANSAQYALGVNLSAIAQLLGVDETVLYSGFENIGNDGSATYNLTELPTNFNKIKIYWCLRNNSQFEQGNKGVGSVEYDMNLYSADYTYIAGFMEGATNNTDFQPYRYDANIANIRTTTWSQNGQLTRLSDNTILNNNAQWFHIYKIIGIGRKQ